MGVNGSPSFRKRKMQKKNLSKKQRKICVFFCSVSQVHINPEKTRKKHKNDFLYVGLPNPSWLQDISHHGRFTPKTFHTRRRDDLPQFETFAPPPPCKTFRTQGRRFAPYLRLFAPYVRLLPPIETFRPPREDFSPPSLN